jgi:uncharacterized membrane protein
VESSLGLARFYTFDPLWMRTERETDFMKKLVLLAAVGLALAGCQSDSQRDRALVGGGLGAATGAAIGAAATGDVGGALVGGAIGAAGGAIVGGATTPKNCVAYDRYGNPYRVACP